MSTRKLVAVDFDGVLHRYSKGWHDGTIYDEPVPGAMQWLAALLDTFEVVIVSTRMHTAEGRDAVQVWIAKHMRSVFGDEWSEIAARLRYSFLKPPAWVTIDDRALTFDGDFSSPRWRAEALEAFSPWYTRVEPGDGDVP